MNTEIKAVLTRYRLPDKTVGKLVIGGFSFDTIELPWRDNKRNISCYKDGLYTYVLDYSNNKKRDVIELRNVENRSQIQFHSINFKGNIEKQLDGCTGLDGLEAEQSVNMLLGKQGVIKVVTINT